MRVQLAGEEHRVHVARRHYRHERTGLTMVAHLPFRGGRRGVHLENVHRTATHSLTASVCSASQSQHARANTANPFSAFFDPAGFARALTLLGRARDRSEKHFITRE